MISRRVTFEEVGFKVPKSGKCAVCGKRCAVRKKFYMTLNPFNKNADGTTRTREDIRKALDLKAAEWMKLPPMHVGCESENLKVKKGKGVRL